MRARGGSDETGGRRAAPPRPPLPTSAQDCPGGPLLHAHVIGSAQRREPASPRRAAAAPRRHGPRRACRRPAPPPTTASEPSQVFENRHGAPGAGGGGGGGVLRRARAGARAVDRQNRGAAIAGPKGFWRAGEESRAARGVRGAGRRAKGAKPEGSTKRPTGRPPGARPTSPRPPAGRQAQNGCGGHGGRKERGWGGTSRLCKGGARRRAPRQGWKRPAARPCVWALAGVTR
jgi:hypothetical protein